MQQFKADLHMHTVLSPCGSLDMSPGTIISRAKDRGLDIIGITDHNHTAHCQVVSEIASEQNLTVLAGAEVTSKEEVHCLAFFEDFETLRDFQELLNKTLAQIPNKPDLFGHQVVVNRQEEILEEVSPLLISATSLSIDQLENEVHNRNGLFIPAHVNRSAYSLISQLGFISPDIRADALEISSHTTEKQMRSEHPHLEKISFIQSSDAHFPDDIGKVNTRFLLAEPTFAEIKKALHLQDGRKVWIPDQSL